MEVFGEDGRAVAAQMVLVIGVLCGNWPVGTGLSSR